MSGDLENYFLHELPCGKRHKTPNMKDMLKNHCNKQLRSVNIERESITYVISSRPFALPLLGHREVT
jgi:hypothetical protein